MKKFFDEFKEFALKGNVVSMAVGIIIGGAFQAIVKSLTEDIITPLINAIVGDKTLDFSSIQIPQGSGIMVGNFINAVINFLIMAFVLFMIVRTMNRMMDAGHKHNKAPEPEPEPEPHKCPYCFSEIDENATRCPHCTSQLEQATIAE